MTSTLIKSQPNLSLAALIRTRVSQAAPVCTWRQNRSGSTVFTVFIDANSKIIKHAEDQTCTLRDEGGGGGDARLGSKCGNGSRRSISLTVRGYAGRVAPGTACCGDADSRPIRTGRPGHCPDSTGRYEAGHSESESRGDRPVTTQRGHPHIT